MQTEPRVSEICSGPWHALSSLSSQWLPHTCKSKLGMPSFPPMVTIRCILLRQQRTPCKNVTGRSTCCQAWRHEFKPQNTHLNKRRQLTPPWHAHHHTHSHSHTHTRVSTHTHTHANRTTKQPTAVSAPRCQALCHRELQILTALDWPRESHETHLPADSLNRQHWRSMAKVQEEKAHERGGIPWQAATSEPATNTTVPQPQCNSRPAKTTPGCGHSTMYDRNACRQCRAANGQLHTVVKSFWHQDNLKRTKIKTIVTNMQWTVYPELRCLVFLGLMSKTAGN